MIEMTIARSLAAMCVCTLLTLSPAILGNAVPISGDSQASAHAATATVSAQALSRLIGSGQTMGVSAGSGTTSQPEAERAGAEPHDPSCPQDYGYLTTRGDWIVSAADPSCDVRLASVTWYGFQSSNFVPAGLDFESYPRILAEIASLGFNSIRIPLTDELVKYNRKIDIKGKKWLKAEPVSLRDDSSLHPLTLLDDIVAQAGQDHLMVILDDHFSKARNAEDVANHVIVKKGRSAATRSGDDFGCRPVTACPLWYGEGYSTNQWIKDWVTLAKRYLNDPTVIGFDLRNEPHTNWLGNGWNLKTYLEGGATWGKCGKALCGKDAKLWSQQSNWAWAATTAGNAILKVNPHLLMFVEGTQLYPQTGAGHKVEAYWWGSILEGVATDPIHFDVPDQLVYSPHEWGPWKCCGDESVKEFGPKTTYASVTKIFEKNWGYILSDPKVQAPIWLGELNTCNVPRKETLPSPPQWRNKIPIKTAAECVFDTRPGSEGQWFQILISFLQQNPEVSWSYYSINATNVLNQPSNNSVLGCPHGSPKKCNPWAQVRVPSLMTYLKTIEWPPS